MGTGFEPVYTALQAAASPLGQPTIGTALAEPGADDGTRTRDPHLGKVMLYQLSHIRKRNISLSPPRSSWLPVARRARKYFTRPKRRAQTNRGPSRLSPPNRPIFAAEFG